MPTTLMSLGDMPPPLASFNSSPANGMERSSQSGQAATAADIPREPPHMTAGRACQPLFKGDNVQLSVVVVSQASGIASGVPVDFVGSRSSSTGIPLSGSTVSVPMTPRTFAIAVGNPPTPGGQLNEAHEATPSSSAGTLLAAPTAGTYFPTTARYHNRTIDSEEAATAESNSRNSAQRASCCSSGSTETTNIHHAAALVEQKSEMTSAPLTADRLRAAERLIAGAMAPRANLRNYWYPLTLSRDIGAGEIVGLHLLGDPICLVRSNAIGTRGKVACFADFCAHRGAPLSMTGSMDGEYLVCGLHRWKFNMHGELVAVGGKMPREIWSYGSDGEQSEKCDGKLRNVYAYPVVEKHGSSSVVAWLLKVRQCFTHTQTRLGLVWVWPGPEMDANPALIPSHLFGESGVGMDRLSSPANPLMQDDTNTPKQTSSAATGPSTNLTTSPLKRLRFGSIAIDMDLDHSLMLEHVLIRKSDTGEMLIDNKTQNMRHVDESLREQLALTVMMMPSSGNGLAVEGKDTAILATHVAALRGVWTTAYATAERSWWRDLVSFSSDWFVVEREVVEFHPPCHVLVEYRYKRFGWKTREVVHCIPTRRQHMRLIYRYATDYSWLTAYRNWAPYRYIVLALSTVRFHRYCNVLRGQDVRLEQGARNLIERMVSLTPMDLLPRFYRRWFAKSCGKDIINNSALQTPLPAVDDSTYIRHCILDGPWFAGWASADHQSCDGSCEDMEDYFPSAACNGSCGKASPSPAWITSPAKSTSPILDNLDTTYSIPCQRGVDNSAYTWRKDYALGRGVESTNEPSYALRYASALAISGILLFALQRSA